MPPTPAGSQFGPGCDERGAERGHGDSAALMTMIEHGA